jgi:hypothetical protein
VSKPPGERPAALENAAEEGFTEAEDVATVEENAASALDQDTDRMPS